MHSDPLPAVTVFVGLQVKYDIVGSLKPKKNVDSKKEYRSRFNFIANERKLAKNTMFTFDIIPEQYQNGLSAFFFAPPTSVPYITGAYRDSVIMRKSFYIDTAPAFGNLISKEYADGLELSLPFSDGDILYRKKGGKNYIEQSFKGRLGYLQHYDITLDEVTTLPVTITRPDLYAAYPMHADENFQLRDAENECIATLRKRRARYIYLPAGQYSLRLSAGNYQLFGFYFDVGIFDSGADRAFSFLQPLLEAHRQQAPVPLLSPDFSVGRTTESYIQSLCKNLKKHDLDSQVYIISQLKELIKLSKRKIYRELGVSEPQHTILQNAKDLIERGVDTQGMDYTVSALPKILPIGKANLQLLFKKHFGITPNNYKKSYIIEKSKDMLSAGYPVISIADALGFKHERSFYRLFKKLAGYSPKAYFNLSKGSDHIK